MTDQAFKGVALKAQFNLDEYLARIRAMSDPQLREEGKNLTFLCSAKQNMSKSPKAEWAEKLEVCRIEWRRRHPRPTAK
jgi:hypothetical protein